MIFSHTTAASLTLSFLCAFHRKDIQTVRLLSHPDMIWIRSSDNVSLKGRESVINFLCVQRQAGPFQIADYHYIPVTTDHGLIVLTGRYDGKFISQSSQDNTIRRSFTFVWTYNKTHWQAVHIHTSPLPIPSASINFYGFSSKGTYKYLMKSDCIYLPTGHSRCRLFRTGEILYAEASNSRCIICTGKKHVQISITLKNLKTSLPPYFLTIHRSYIINARYVTEIGRYYVQMKNGAVLPVPAKKYRQVQKQLEDLLKKESMTSPWS